jgi:hypothetical protein
MKNKSEIERMHIPKPFEGSEGFCSCTHPN